MSALRVWLSRLSTLFSGERSDAALDEDVHAHLEHLENEHRGPGVSPPKRRTRLHAATLAGSSR
jgi:hypothetical protein